MPTFGTLPIPTFGTLPIKLSLWQTKLAVFLTAVGMILLVYQVLRETEVPHFHFPEESTDVGSVKTHDVADNDVRRITPYSGGAYGSVSVTSHHSNNVDFHIHLVSGDDIANLGDDNANLTSSERPVTVSQGAVPPNINFSSGTVYFVWCSPVSAQFQFVHYLSLRSAILYLKADTVLFYYANSLPASDVMYNSWLDDLTATVPFLRKIRLRSVCKGHNPDVEFIVRNLIWPRGGLYIDGNTMLTAELTAEQRGRDVVYATEVRGRVAFILAKRGLAKTTVDALAAIATSSGSNTNMYSRAGVTSSLTCAHLSFTPDKSALIMSHCITFNNTVSPIDIFELDNFYGRAIRSVCYGSPDIRRPVQSSDDLIPNIGHVIWWGHMPFSVYLSVLSQIYVGELDIVYIHGPQPPTGQYWSLIKNHPKIQLVFREMTNEIFGRPLKKIAHISDTLRADIMLRYGGVYIDTDAVFYQPLTKDLRGYDAVASRDIMLPRGIVNPRAISNGVLAGKPGAEFWQRYQSSMRDFDDSNWLGNSCERMMAIKERYPHLIHIDGRLQLICASPSFTCVSTKSRNGAVVSGLQSDVYVYHFAWPEVLEYVSPRSLLAANGTIADLGKIILRKAGMLEYFTDNGDQYESLVLTVTSTVKYWVSFLTSKITDFCCET